MEQKMIKIEWIIEQIEDGKKYKGSFSINGRSFNYDLVFTSSIPDIAHLPQEDRTGEKINKFVAVKIKSGDTKITLTKKERHLFVILVGDLAINFYDDPLIRDANDLATKYSTTISKIINAVFPLRAKTTSTCILTTEACKILNAPKFGCELST